MAGDKISWEHICSFFPILKDEQLTIRTEYPAEFDSREFNSFVTLLENEKLDTFIEDLIISQIEETMRKKIAPSFWSYFYNAQHDLEEDFIKFRDAIAELNEFYLSFLPTMQRLEEMRDILGKKRPIYGETNLLVVLKLIIRTVLQSKLPIPKHQAIIEEFYKLSFRVFYNTDRNRATELMDFNESGEENRCGGCSGIEYCHCDSIISDFHTTNRILIQLELLERLAGEVLTSLINKQIELYVQETCKGSFNHSFIEPLETWLDHFVVGWLTRLYSSGPESPAIKEKLNIFKQKLHHLLYETYTRLRIDQLFTIIIDYPESEAAVEDLRVCLEKTELRPHLVERLQSALQSRLLHPGVNTPDIITAYVHSIRALRNLDPSGLLLETVTHPVRQYLRLREDTMRCVVMRITEEGPDGDLADELARGEETPQDEGHWAVWSPPPIQPLPPAKSSKERQSWDIISMLVTVYGSKEMFVHEYRNLLADRLLTQYSYNTEKEIRYLELLKLRFGDSQMHFCEVMLKDIHDSKRMNTHLHSEPNFGLSKQDFHCTCMILSAQYWPSFKEETLQLPQKIKEHLDVYTKAFETLKGNRTLSWKPHLGSVNIEIELKNRTISLTVTPTQAAIIWHFQDKSEWTIDELSSVLLIPPSLLRRRIAFWQSQGLLRETIADTYCLTEETSGGSGREGKGPEVCEDEETESITASAQDQREEELQVFWSYIVGMLTNLDSLPPERIHQMLKMFAGQGPSGVECSLQQLRHFLDRKVREHKLLFSGGYYRLPK